MAKCFIHDEENCVRCALDPVASPTIHLNILLDISTSMYSRWHQTISGLNEYIESLRLDDHNYKVTITEFGLENEVRDLCSEADLDKVPHFDGTSYQPHGRGTALWGAVGITLKKVNTTEPVLFVVITDGEENSSHTWNQDSVNTLIAERQKLGNYTFAYLGVAIEAWGNASAVAAFAASSCNLQSSDYSSDTYKGLATLTRSYSRTMSVNSAHGGPMNVACFYSQPQDGTSDESVDNVLSHSNTAASTQSGWKSEQ